MHYQNKQTQLYILGDWFNAWIGDDYSAPWLEEIVEALKVFNQKGNRVYFQVGNRDFALNQVFLDKFNGVLLPDIYYLNIAGHQYRLEHGDALCTDDISYQRFKNYSKSFLVAFYAVPLEFPYKTGQWFSQKKSFRQTAKSYEIMDVNEQAVLSALTDVDILIHGHTHRPAIHQLQHKQRIVLGDWREDQAYILEIDPSSNTQWLELIVWNY